MRLGRRLTGVSLLGAVAGVLSASSASAAIYDIGTLGGTSSRVLGMSQDGSYVAGRALDGAAAPLPVLFRVSDQTLIALPNPSGSTTLGQVEARGVDIQAPIGLNPAQLSVSGSIGNIMRYYRAPITTPGAGTWASTPLTTNVNGAQFNTSRIDTSNRENHVGVITAPAGQANRGYRVRIDTALVVAGADYRNNQGTTNTAATVNSIGGTGVPVGYDRINAGGQRRALLMTSASTTGPQTVVPGGAAIRSEANGASADGLILCGQDYEDIVNTINQAMIWKVGDPSMTLLGKLAGDSQSFAFACNNSKLTGGFSFNAANAITGERAVLWDPTGLWDSGATNQAKLLTSLLTAKGIDWSAWSFLTRVVSISNDGRTIAGWGNLTNGQEHGFVVTLPVPEPATIGLVALGGALCLRRGRRS